MKETIDQARSALFAALCAFWLFLPVVGHSTDIPGVQPTAYDQPQIYGALIRSGDTPLVQDLLGDVYFKAFLDTGASGIALDPFYAGALGYNLPNYVDNTTEVVFSDVAVDGSVDYNVSEPLQLRLAGFQPYTLVNDAAAFNNEYNQSTGPARLQLGPIGSTGQVNVIGMPALLGKVMVVDPKPLDRTVLGLSLFDQLHAYVYNPGTPFEVLTASTDPGIPATDRHIQLTMVDVGRFTQLTPTGAEPVALAHNPFIGPNPLALIDTGVPAGSTPGISIYYGGLEATGSFLFDTGAAFTFISQAMAAQINVRYRTATYGTAAPILETFNPADPEAQGAEITNTLQYDVAGIGGSITVAGFYLDSLLMRTAEGAPGNPDDNAHLRYLNPPVIIYDITVVDPNPGPGNGDTLTLDGIFGMNMLVASALVDVSNPLLPIFANLRLSPFEWLVFDEPNAILGLKIGPSIDDDADDDGVRDADDLCPVNADPGQLDTDFDGAGDACDALPLINTETLDSDNDGTGDNADPDDDNDGVDDISDNCPLTYNPGQEDFDFDSFGDACEPDDDNDGIDDPVDAFPYDASETQDTDGDGIGNNADLDDDNDGLSDEFELANGLDPLDSSDCPTWICPSGVTSGWRVILLQQ